MNDYEQKQADRKARLEERADKTRQQGQVIYKEARRMGEAIPFGQPILVGHHSEGRDRRYRGRIHDKFGKSFALDDKADYYERKAASVGTGGISSDDPDAVQKLKAQLEGCQRSQETMKAANKAIRAGKTDAEKLANLQNLGFTEDQAKATIKPDFCGRVGFPAYSLSNNSANMRRIELRIKELESRREAEAVEVVGAIYTYKEDPEENRAMFLFDGKPAAEVRAILKRHAFHWSPSRDGQPWVRKLTGSGRWAAECVRKSLDALPAAQAGN